MSGSRGLLNFMSIARLSAISLDSFDMLSVDLFDAILLRDESSQRERFGEISSLAATRLREVGYDVGPGVLAALKSDPHAMAYRAVKIERPAGDAQLRSC